MTIHEAFENLQTDLRSIADAERVPKMEAYMRDQFAFLGVTSPERKAVQKPLMQAAKKADIDEVLDIADLCWSLEEREFQYVGCELLRAQAKRMAASDLDRLHRLITTKSWWDTIDGLASHPVGTLVRNHPELTETMDAWIDDDNFWVARTAILHQLRYKQDLDEQRLFGYVVKRAGDTEFFIRKALGWALRDYARVAPDAVRSFVREHEDQLSGLTKREALKHL